MDWTQVFTIIGTILPATIGCTYIFYANLKSDMLKIETFHREDMIRMDEKWERLFERLLIQDQAKG